MTMTGAETSTPTPAPSAAPSLNVYEKIAVIRLPSDTLNYEDSQGNSKSVSVEELGGAIASATPLQAQKPKLDIPVPRIHNVEGYDKEVQAVYVEPLSYVRYHKPTPSEWKSKVEYIADNEDENWLRMHSKFGQEANPPRLNLSMLEHMLDILEKETAFDSIITTHQAELHYQKHIPDLYRLFPPKAQQGEVTCKVVTNEVYNYWVQKRGKLKRPLLRRFWPVTSTEDTNPHLVFRPREKEKYKLRKKRQNDAGAYRKMKQLRGDFDNLRAVLDLVRRREEIYRIHLKLQIELFEQRLFDATDTTNRDRKVDLGAMIKVQQTLSTLPNHFDIHKGGRNTKRTRNAGVELPGTKLPTALGAFAGEPTSASGNGPNIAGRNNGTPAPHFLNPLATRETFVANWDGVLPYDPSAACDSTSVTFRHRPRVGRGGRVCIDRVPQPPPPPNVPPMKFYRAGIPLHRAAEPQARLLDLLPNPIDETTLSRKIYMAPTKGDSGLPGDDDNDESVVELDKWLETDEQLWGEERYMLGPL